MKTKSYTYISSISSSCVSIIMLMTMLLAPVKSDAQKIISRQQWYVAGENLEYAVNTGNGDSTIGYVELSDASRLYASCMTELVNGTCIGSLELPSDMHSGFYRLSFYTRNGKHAMYKNVAIVNTLSVSANDDITWKENTDVSSKSIAEGADTETTFSTDAATTVNGVASSSLDKTNGHTILARLYTSPEDSIADIKDINATLGVVGKQVHVFDGEIVNDNTVAFHTFDVNGKQPVVAYAETKKGKPLKIEILSPYVSMKGKAMPHLRFSFNRKEVEARSMAMQRIARNDSIAPLPYIENVLGAKPTYSYDLDDYRPFASIRDIVVEYVTLVHRITLNGRSALVLFNSSGAFTRWPALVLIDGVPVVDIERFYAYDARRVKYFNIYDNRFTFGKNIYNGIISIVTRTGKMTNFPIEKTASYNIYDFPEKHPSIKE